ncbi:MAG TPA: uroporphyrinogen decarboxylase family protein [Cyclobacteriaceae bacterium]|nr:uroporphyrinogen decarboxylase family protein [Cyclobacteriaceae bacterium]
MNESTSSRERLLAALHGDKPDHVPMSFMIFTALRKRIKQTFGRMDPYKLIELQLDLGLDAFVDLRFFTNENEFIGHSDAPGFPVRFDNRVSTRMVVKKTPGERYPVVNKIYSTPKGDLSISVNLTDDWPYGNIKDGDYQLPFLDDFLAPRCRKYLVEKEADLAPLKYLLVRPTADDLRSCHRSWDLGKKIAREKDLLLVGGWGVGADALAWFCGLQNAVILAYENPSLLHELLGIIGKWNRPRMEAYLDYGVDLFIRRAWYEGTDFWSPDLFREFFSPVIKEEVRLAHQAGAKYGYILTSGSMALNDQLLGLGIDVLIGADPVQGKGTDLAMMKKELKDEICIWGGVNGFVTVETGTPEEIDKAVQKAIETLGTDGFILSPVDNVSDPSESVWNNVLALIESWKKYR